MQIKNYPQFAKKTFFLGLSRPFVLIFMVVFGFTYILLTGCSTVFRLIPAVAFISDYINLLKIISIFLALFSYLYFAYKFKMNNYWFDRACLKKIIKRQYPFLFKQKTIISR